MKDCSYYKTLSSLGAKKVRSLTVELIQELISSLLIYDSANVTSKSSTYFISSSVNCNSGIHT